MTVGTLFLKSHVEHYNYLLDLLTFLTCILINTYLFNLTLIQNYTFA